ncbi:hypothetical protein NDU88_003578 [Pleurodeles waltl]|uniref:Uncharacterized protein n=1 Tax=Pleurodeles waltl TaxID=8319 RepID=A0AAV7WTH0_PLEWA|nr:hypothetical protein NDU88_003578 [Pleurodeles waltl]
MSTHDFRKAGFSSTPSTLASSFQERGPGRISRRLLVTFGFRHFRNTFGGSISVGTIRVCPPFRSRE